MATELKSGKKELLSSLCLVVKSAEQSGTVQKNKASVFRRRFAASCCCRISEVWTGRSPWVSFRLRGYPGRFAFPLDAPFLGCGWVLEVTLQSRTGKLQQRLNSSAKPYGIGRIVISKKMYTTTEKKKKRVFFFTTYGIMVTMQNLLDICAKYV